MTTLGIMLTLSIFFLVTLGFVKGQQAPGYVVLGSSGITAKNKYGHPNLYKLLPSPHNGYPAYESEEDGEIGDAFIYMGRTGWWSVGYSLGGEEEVYGGSLYLSTKDTQGGKYLPLPPQKSWKRLMPDRGLLHPREYRPDFSITVETLTTRQADQLKKDGHYQFSDRLICKGSQRKSKKPHYPYLVLFFETDKHDRDNRFCSETKDCESGIDEDIFECKTSPSPSSHNEIPLPVKSVLLLLLSLQLYRTQMSKFS